MKWIAPVALLLFAGLLLAQEKREVPPQIPHQVVENFLQFPDNT